MDEVIIRTSLGARDPSIFYEWNSLWQLDEPQKADIALKKAQATKLDADMGLVPTVALAKGRENQLVEDGTYPGLESAIEDAAASGDNVPEALKPPPPPPALPPPGGTVPPAPPPADTPPGPPKTPPAASDAVDAVADLNTRLRDFDPTHAV
jgi:hypothetical protein